MFSRKLSYFLGAGLLALAVASPAAAQSSDDIGIEILQLLVDQGVIPAAKAQDILARAKEAAAAKSQAPAAVASNVIDVPYVPETLRLQIKEEVKQEVMASAKAEGWVAPNTLPTWLDGVKLSGDFRLRYDGDRFDSGNFPFFPDTAAINQAGGVSTAAGFPLLNTTVDRHRVRYRIRLGVDADVGDKVKVGVRLASGDDAGPISTNRTMGDFFQKDSLYIDRAFISLTPIDGVVLTGGRMANPFYSTDVIWDQDINPEGVALSVKRPAPVISDLTLFGTAGAFPLLERKIDHNDRWLMAAQAGAEYAATDDLKVKGAVGYYDFQDVQSRKNAADGSRLNDFTAPTLISQGNSVFNIRTDGLTTLAGLASEFRLLSFTSSAAYTGFGPTTVRLTGEYVTNLGFDRSDIADLRGEPGVEPGNDAWQVRLDVGRDTIAKRGDWQVSAAYKRIETDAVLDIFTDSDFGIGGTDQEGYVLEGFVGIYDNTSVGLSWRSSNSINRPPLGVEVLQFSLNSRF